MIVMSVREFSRNKTAAWAKLESGQTIEITRYGKQIATMVPTLAPPFDGCAPLVIDDAASPDF